MNTNVLMKNHIQPPYNKLLTGKKQPIQDYYPLLSTNVHTFQQQQTQNLPPKMLSTILLRSTKNQNPYSVSAQINISYIMLFISFCLLLFASLLLAAPSWKSPCNLSLRCFPKDSIHSRWKVLRKNRADGAEVADLWDNSNTKGYRINHQWRGEKYLEVFLNY